MSTIVAYSNMHAIPFASEFFMTRRFILDGRQHLAAHELIFRRDAEGSRGMAAVLADAMQHGLARIICGPATYLQVDAEALMSELMQDMPSEHVVLSIVESTPAAPDLIERIALLAQSGFKFALDASSDSQGMRALLPFADTLKIDIRGKTPEQLGSLCRSFKPHGRKLLAQGVDSIEQFELCAAFGFDYFQGAYFVKPQILEGKKLSPSQVAITELMSLIESDADNAEIERSIKSNVALGLNLLRLADMPAISLHRIGSLHQALAVVGRDQLQRWLRIMLDMDAGSDAHRMMPLLMLAATRGRLMELTAKRLMPGNRGIADTAFMVGIMSLMDAVFCMPMTQILGQIPVIDEASDALLQRKGYFGILLMLAEYTERLDKDKENLAQLAHGLRLSPNDLYLLQLAAFEWSDEVSRNLH